MAKREGFRWLRGPWRPTVRQRQVLDALLEGKTNAEIGSNLGISTAAVRWQVSEMLGETGLDDRHALAQWWRTEREKDVRQGKFPWLAWFLRYKMQLPAGIALVLVGVTAYLVLFTGGDSRRGSTGTLLPLGTDLPDSETRATATIEPHDRGLEDVEAVVVRWQRWSELAGSWNGVLLQGGGEHREPLEFDHGAIPVVSPDGNLATHVARASGEVVVFDLDGWQPVFRVATAPGLFLTYWSADSSQVYGTREYCAEPAERGVCPSGLVRDLWRVDLFTRSAVRLVDFDFSVIQLVIHPDRDARRAYALGVNTDVCCAIEPVGEPFLAVLNLEAGSVEHLIQLPGLLAGQLGDGMADGSPGSFVPALTLSPDGRRLYLVEADTDAALVIDTETFVHERRELREKRSAISRFGDLLESLVIDVAEAKGGSSYHRQASITPDGRYLVIGGSSAVAVERSDGSTSWEERPADLLVVDTETMIIELRAPGVGWFNLGPDGNFVLAHGSYYDYQLGVDPQGGGVVASGLKVIDLESPKEVAHLWPNEEVRPLVFSVDGRRAFVQSEGPGMASAKRAGIGCSGDCHRFNLIDLDAMDVMWRGKLASDETILAFPPR